MTGIWDSQPPVGGTFAGGTATLGEIAGAAVRSSAYVENTNAGDGALEAAYDARIDAVRKATGVALSNPMRQVVTAGKALVRPMNAEQDFKAKLDDLEARFPDMRRDIRAGVPVRLDAEQLARDTDARFQELMASRDDTLLPFAAALAGGFAGSLRDPVQVASLFAGGGIGGGRTIAARIASTMFREALVNGGVEAAMQPMVQSWREEAGLPHGFWEAARNVAFAAGTAGIVGGGARGAGELTGRLLGRADPERVIPSIPEASPVRRAAEGDPASLVERLAPVRENLPPPQRGALSALETDLALQDMRRPSVLPDTEDGIMSRAVAAAQNPDEMPRLAEALMAPETPAARAPVPPAAAQAAPGAPTVPATSVHGPVLPPESYGGDWKTLVAKMKEAQGGDAPGALSHPATGPIDVIWGRPEGAAGEGYGLAKIIQKHPEVVDELPRLISEMRVRESSPNRINLESADHRAGVRLEYDGAAKHWLVTAFVKNDRRGRGTTLRPPGSRADTSSAPPAVETIIQPAREIQTFEPGPQAEAQVKMLETDLTAHQDMMVPVAAGDGQPVMKPLGDALDDARRGEAMAAFIEGCTTT